MHHSKTEKDPDSLIRRYQRAKERRGNWESHWADYIGDDDLPWKGTQAKRWLGTLWMPHSGLTKTSSVRYCYWYHKTAVGHAVGSDVKTDITWHGDRAANFINNRAYARLGSRVHYICMCDPGSFLRLGYSAAWRAPDKRSMIS